MEFSIGVFKCYNINLCINKSILLKLCRKCFKLIQNTQPTKLTVFFLRYLYYITVLLHVSVHEVIIMEQASSVKYSTKYCLHFTIRYFYTVHNVVILCTLLKIRKWWHLRRGTGNGNLEEKGAQCKGKLIEWLLVYWGIMVF